MNKRRPIICALSVLLIFLAGLFLFFYPGDREELEPRHGPEMLAHRGVHAHWKKGTYDASIGCEASHIDPPTHDYIENTIESIGAAFNYGATIVEVDIRRTRDDHLVVFHDYLLECRTDGRGDIDDCDLAYLKTLDIGYGYTPDDGRTYPFRGRGAGKMPTLEEVLRAYPGGRFLIHHKDGTIRTAEILIETIKVLGRDQRKMLYYQGPPEIFVIIHNEVPEVTRLFPSRREMAWCLAPYVLSGGIADFPDEYAGLAVGMEMRYTKYVPGWPYRFIKKAHKNKSDVYIVIDTLKDLEVISDIPVDGIITDHIELIGKPR